MTEEEQNISQIFNNTNIGTTNETNNQINKNETNNEINNNTNIDSENFPLNNTISQISNNTNITNVTEEINIDYEKNKSFFAIIIIFLIDFFMVIGPSISYILQAQKFIKTKSSKGFSKSICLILYLANILRVFFWIGKPFRVTLLLQSIIIIICQMILIHLWVKYHEKDEQKKVQNVSKSDNNQQNEIFYSKEEKKEYIEYLIDWSDTVNISKFWNWKNEFEYYKFMLIIILFLLLISGLIGIHNKVLSNFYGTISVIFEAFTCAPQMITNFQTKNTKNVSSPMIVLWLIGDTAKMIYNIIYKTPIQMIISGIVQVLFDLIVILQIYVYKDPHKIFGTNHKKYVKNFDNVGKDSKSFNTSGNGSIGKNVIFTGEKENHDKIEVLDKSEDNKEGIQQNNIVNVNEKKSEIKNEENNDVNDKKNGNEIEAKNNENSGKHEDKMIDDDVNNSQ